MLNEIGQSNLHQCIVEAKTLIKVRSACGYIELESKIAEEMQAMSDGKAVIHCFRRVDFD